MFDRKKQEYQTPKVTAVAFVIERGFENSPQGQVPESSDQLNDYQPNDATGNFI